VPGSQQPIEPSQASQFALQGLQTKPHCIIRIILNLGNYGAELMLSISFASASPLGAYCNSAINGFGDHALFPEEYTVSGGRSVMFVECDDQYRLPTTRLPRMSWGRTSSLIHDRFTDRFPRQQDQDLSAPALSLCSCSALKLQWEKTYWWR
jgi:hypothetical protein